jgi:hypothetical protein
MLVERQHELRRAEAHRAEQLAVLVAAFHIAWRALEDRIHLSGLEVARPTKLSILSAVLRENGGLVHMRGGGPAVLRENGGLVRMRGGGRR